MCIRDRKSHAGSNGIGGARQATAINPSPSEIVEASSQVAQGTADEGDSNQCPESLEFGGSSEVNIVSSRDRADLLILQAIVEYVSSRAVSSFDGIVRSPGVDAFLAHGMRLFRGF